MDANFEIELKLDTASTFSWDAARMATRIDADGNLIVFYVQQIYVLSSTMIPIREW